MVIRKGEYIKDGLCIVPTTTKHFGLKSFLLGDFECVEKKWLPDLFVYLLFYALE